MKKNQQSFLIVFIVLLIILTIALFIIGNKNLASSNKTCTSDLLTYDIIPNLGKVDVKGKVTNAEIAKIEMNITGENKSVLNNEYFINIPIYNLEITTSINHKMDKSIWLGVSIKDILEYYKEDSTKTMQISSSNSDNYNTYKNADNLYLLLKKNDNDIILNKETMTIIANVKEDSSLWVYKPSSIYLK